MHTKKLMIYDRIKTTVQQLVFIMTTPNEVKAKKPIWFKRYLNQEKSRKQRLEMTENRKIQPSSKYNKITLQRLHQSKL